MTFNTGNIVPGSIFKNQRSSHFLQIWLKFKLDSFKDFWTIFKGSVWRCIANFKLYWHYGVRVCWAMKSKNQNTRLKKPVSRMQVGPAPILWLSVWPTKKQAKSKPFKKPLVISQSWLRWVLYHQQVNVSSYHVEVFSRCLLFNDKVDKRQVGYGSTVIPNCGAWLELERTQKTSPTLVSTVL